MAAPQQMSFVREPLKLRVFVCAYHPAAQVLSPKHNIYAFIIIVILSYICRSKRMKIFKKRPDLAHFFK